MKKIFLYWVYLLVVWGLFRLTIRLPSLLEEMVIKPIVWGWPILGWQLVGKNKVKVFSGNMLMAVIKGAGLGLAFVGVMIVAKWIKAEYQFGGRFPYLNLDASEVVTIGLATAIVEEMVFAGFILGRLKQVIKDNYPALLITTVMFTAINLPIAFFIYGYTGWQVVGFAAIVALAALARYWLMLDTKNLWSPIVAHWFWIVAAWTL